MRTSGSKMRLGGLFLQIFLSSMLCMLIPVVVVAVVSAVSVRSSLIDKTNQELTQLSIEKMAEVDAILDNQKKLTKAIADSPYIAKVVTRQFRNGLDEKANALLNSYLVQVFNDANGMYENIFISCGDEGIADGLGGATIHNYAQEGWYTSVMQNGTFFGTDISPASGLPVYNLVYQIKDPENGEVVGTINTALSLGEMTRSILGSLTQEGMTAMILGPDGYVMASADSSQILSLNFNTANDSTKAAMTQILSGAGSSLTFDLNGTTHVGASRGDGMMYTLVFEPVSVYTATINRLVLQMLTVAVVCTILAALVIILVCISIIRPLGRMVSLIEGYGAADFTEPVPDGLLRRKDEIGTLARSMSHMQGVIREIISDIVSETTSVSGSINVSNENLQELKDRIGIVNDLTSERAAEMEETAASTELINQNALSIQDSVDEISRQTERGMEIVEAIDERASKIKADAEASQRSVTKLSQELRDKLNEAVEQSKAVEKINELSDAILGIASETNLLSLNASIEAARAGEAGRGFAVVAEQVGKLAVDSQETAGQIQDVTEQVINAVSNLADNSIHMVEFVDEKILKDYGNMVDLGQHYYDDAETVRELVDTINGYAEALSETVSSMTRSIGEISTANSEGADGITNISQNTSDIQDMSANVSDIMNSVQDSTDRLKDSVSRLTV